MGLLTVIERQKRLKELGYYDGRVDGLEGVKTSRAYADLQAKYFVRAQDVDGKYGQNTDNLLRSVWNCRNSRYFILKEFRCKCDGKYCSGYPAEVNQSLVNGLNNLRSKVGALTITSGLRCSKWNALQGGASGSRHMSGKACDVKGKATATKDGRTNVKTIWMSQRNARYTYCGDDSKKYHMGTSVHVDVK